MKNIKIALVTGFCRGIGKAITTTLLKKGYIVIGVHKGGHDYEGFDKYIKAKKLIVIDADLSNRRSVAKLIKQLRDYRFDAIINNAGIIEFEDFTNYNYDIWDRTLEINLNAPFRLVMELKNNINKGGSVVNIASTDGMTGCFASMAYSVSKAGLINLTKSLGNNLGMKGIRVNAIAPGWIDTDMTTDASSGSAKNTPLERNGTPEEIANIVQFLISDRASFVNGSCIVVDGGYTNVDVIMMEEAKI